MNLKNTVLKFKNFAATQILREINFGHFEALKTAILTILAVLNLISKNHNPRHSKLPKGSF